MCMKKSKREASERENSTKDYQLHFFISKENFTNQDIYIS